MSGKPIRSPSADINACAPSSRKTSSGSATCCGVARPASPTSRVATDLSKVRRELAPSLPTKGTPNVHSTSRSAPSSPSPPCSTGMTTESSSPSSRGIRSALTSVSATVWPFFRSAPARRFPERRDTSRSWLRPPAITNTVMASVLYLGQSGCGQFRFGPGPLAGLACDGVCMPKVRSISSSPFTTWAKRSTPVTIRSGGGKQ